MRMIMNSSMFQNRFVSGHELTACGKVLSWQQNIIEDYHPERFRSDPAKREATKSRRTPRMFRLPCCRDTLPRRSLGLATCYRRLLSFGGLFRLYPKRFGSVSAPV